MSILKRSKFLLILLIYVASVASSPSVCGEISGTQASPGVKMRTINFHPKGGGRYFIEPRVDPFMAQWGVSQQQYFPCRGKVQVPKEAKVNLGTSWESEDGLPHLRVLRPDDLYGLDITGSKVDRNTIKNIFHLKGLKRLSVWGTYMDDAEIARIVRELPQLEELDISYMPTITNRCLDHVAKLKHLRVLILEKTKIDDAGVAKLLCINTLTYLNLSQTKITDASLALLSKMPALSTLNLAATSVTDKGLEHLLALPALKRLDVSLNKVTDRTLRDVIGKMVQLEELNLSNTQVTDAGISHLTKLSNLRKLWLRWLRKVTDASIPQLASHKKLENLELQRSAFTALGIIALGKALPKSEVHGAKACSCKKRERVTYYH
ncbi:MAG TPA: hypothetical protein V6D17_08060 [Candidatus Obscuribacterales bacterium]